MKQSMLYLTVALLSILSLVVMACSSPSSGQEDANNVTEGESRQIAEEYVRQSPTFTFDGMPDSLELVSTEPLRCPQCWCFVYEFESAHAGYGDRTGQMLAQVITPHTARITVQEGAVTSAVLDGRWNMMEQQEMFTEQTGRELAEEFLRNSATFSFDGMPETLELAEILYPDMENAWQFVFRFDSRHAGYGDRTGQMLAQVITPHEAIVTVEEGKVTNAILDQQWDMKAQEMIDGDGTEPKGNSMKISCNEFQNENHITRSVTMAVGESISVELCSNPTTGFQWEQPQLSNPALITILDRHHQAPPPSDKGMAGAPGTRMMDIHAVNPGTGTLSMAYSRPWEGGEKGAWTFTLHITVEGAANTGTPTHDTGTTAPIDASKLADTAWKLASLGTDDNPQSVLEGTRITLDFGAESENGVEFGGSAGCNSYFGTLTVTEAGLEMGTIGATEMWCMEPEGVMEQESEYLSALGSVQHFIATGTSLTMSCSDGTTLTFETQ